MKRWLIPTVLVAGLVATAGPVAAANGAPAAANGEPPTVIIDGSGTLTGFCNFKVKFEVTGKTKVITTGNERTITTSPGQEITLSAKGESVTFVLTGVRFERTEGGTTEVKVTGQNILINPIKTSKNPGIFFTVGNFNFALDAGGNEERPFNEDGPGQVTDVCAALS
jgi:hypothetical protein